MFRQLCPHYLSFLREFSMCCNLLAEFVEG